MGVLVYQVVALLALHFAPATTRNCSHGDIRMTNTTCYILGTPSKCSMGESLVLTDKTYILAGGLQICVDNIWSSICQGNWNEVDAMVACRQLGLSYLRSCTKSCFGKSVANPGLYDFTCFGLEPKLINCGHKKVTNGCLEAAGIFCAANKSTFSSECKNTSGNDTAEASGCSIRVPINSNTTNTTTTMFTTDKPAYPEVCPTCPNCDKHIQKDSNDANERKIAAKTLTTEQHQTHNNQKDCANDSISMVEIVLATVTALLGTMLVGVVTCLIGTCIKLRNITLNSKPSNNWSMDNHIYGIQHLTSSLDPQEHSQQSASQHTLPPSNLQASSRHSMQLDKDMENEYHTIYSEVSDNDQVYSVLQHKNNTDTSGSVHDMVESHHAYSRIFNEENIPCNDGDEHAYSVVNNGDVTSKENVKDNTESNQVYSVLFEQNRGIEIQLQAKEAVPIPRQTQSDSVYSVLKSEESQMYSQLNS